MLNINSAEQNLSMARSNFVAAILVKHGSRFLERMINFSNPPPYDTWRSTCCYAPKVACIAEMLWHCRVFGPLAKDGMRENVGDCVCKRAFSFAPHRGGRTNHFTRRGQTGGGKAVRTPLNFFQQAQSSKAASDVASSHTGTV